MKLDAAIENLKRERKELHKDMQDVQRMIRTKNRLLLRLLDITKKKNGIYRPPLSLNSQKKVSAPKAQVKKEGYFPLINQQELDDFEKIKCENKSLHDEMIQEARECLKPDGLSKSLHKIINEKLVTFYNMEGQYNLRRLLDYPNLIKILYEAVKEDGITYEQFMLDLRCAIKIIKQKVRDPILI